MMRRSAAAVARRSAAILAVVKARPRRLTVMTVLALPLSLAAICFLAFASGMSLLLEEVPPLQAPNASNFVDSPSEIPQFASCDECAVCIACSVCYAAPSAHYESAFDRCPRTGGACGSPFGELAWCTKACAPYIHLGPERLYCAHDGQYLKRLESPWSSSDSAYCRYRDPNAERVLGESQAHAESATVNAASHARVAPALHVPNSDAAEPRPLVVMLCGRGTCANACYWTFGLRFTANRHGYLYMSPDATVDQENHARWCTPKATIQEKDLEDTRSCSQTDDAAYLMGLIREVARHVESHRLPEEGLS